MAETATKMKLRMSFESNPRVEPIMAGRVPIPGIEIEWERMEPGAAFLHHLTHNDFDAFEFSISHYIGTRARANPAYEGWIMVPIFTSKPTFMFYSLYLRPASGVSSLADLKGKRIGVPDFTMTGAVWFRIVLRVLYGIQPQDIRWVNTRPANRRQGRTMGVDHDTGSGVHIANIDESTTPQQMVERGELDAVLGGSGGPVAAASGIKQFTPQDWLPVLVELQKKIGVTPVNHCVLVQKRLLEERPSLARDLFDAFERSKQEAYTRDPKARAILAELDLARQRELFGEDPYPYGLRANRRVLELIADQNVIDGVIRERPAIDSLVVQGLRST